MSKIADAPGWDSCDVTQLFYNLQRIKIKLTSTQTWGLEVLQIYCALTVAGGEFPDCTLTTSNLNALMGFYLVPFPVTVNEWSRGDDTDTEEHVVLSHSHEFLSVQSRYVTIILARRLVFKSSIMSRLNILNSLKFDVFLRETNMETLGRRAKHLSRKEIHFSQGDFS